MLIVSRRMNERIYIDGEKIKVVVLGFQGSQVRLGIDAPKSISVHRQEVYEKIMREREEEGTKAVLA